MQALSPRLSMLSVNLFEGTYLKLCSDLHCSPQRLLFVLCARIRSALCRIISSLLVKCKLSPRFSPVIVSSCHLATPLMP